MSASRQEIVHNEYRLQDAKAALNRQLKLEAQLVLMKDWDVVKLVKKQMTFKTTTKTLKKEIDYWTRVCAAPKRKRQKNLF